MGEIAEMMLNGTMCQGCGEWLHDGEDGPGYPGFCSACARQQSDKPSPRKNKDFRGDELPLGKKLLTRLRNIEAKVNPAWNYALSQHNRLRLRGFIINQSGMCVLTTKGKELLKENQYAPENT